MACHENVLEIVHHFDELCSLKMHIVQIAKMSGLLAGKSLEICVAFYQLRPIEHWNKHFKIMSTLREAFIETLKDTYDAEHQILKALPRVIKNVENDELKQALESHLKETQEHAKRLEQVFEIFDQPPKRKKCNGMAGLITEGQEVLEEEDGEAALILALQKVEHYEIAAYGALVSWANILEETEAANILKKTLTEEKHADEKLNEIAEDTVNLEEDAQPEQRRAA